MKGVILYVSKYGSTREYAGMIANETGFPAIDLEKVKAPNLDTIDIVVIGSWVLASKFKARSWIVKHWDDLRGRKVILFSVSGAEPDEKIGKEFLDGSLPEEIRNSVIYFPLQGRFLIDQLNFADRNMTKVASRLFGSDPLLRQMMAGIDGVRRENIGPILDAIGKP